ncbi:hypothetical protein RUM44_007657 [Polyplax serrata]|uniref:Uncharacterized protein n=1 Tax=Polyplax serrata TaxID=468196 RepID=A0ABR1BB06_POLSC
MGGGDFVEDKCNSAPGTSPRSTIWAVEGGDDHDVGDKVNPMKDIPMIQLPPAAGMDRLPLPMSFNASDLLLRYPLGFPSPSNQGYLSDFKLHLPASLGEHYI